jgi:hypothetical protein
MVSLNTTTRHFLFGTLVLLSISTTGVRAGVIFTDNFNTYTVSSTLASQSGGTGWSSAYGPGTNTVFGSINGTNSHSVKITQGFSAGNNNDRTFTSAVAFPNTLYISFLFNSSVAGASLSGSDYGVVSISGTRSSSPYAGFELGASGTGSVGFGIKDTVNGNTSRSNAFAAGTSYITMFAFENGSTAGRTTVTVYGSSDLQISSSSLMTAGNQWGQVANVDLSNVSLNTISFYGNSIVSIAGLAGATDSTSGFALTQGVVVPEPGTLLLGGIASACGGTGVWWRRRKNRLSQPTMNRE